MDHSAIPLPDAITDDLTTIITRLDRYKSATLAAIRSLPSIQRWEPSGERSFESRLERSNAAMRGRISEAVASFVYPDEREALEILFDFKNPSSDLGLRQNGAAAALDAAGGGDSFRRGRQRTLLASLADEIYRGEISWLLARLSDVNTNHRLDDWCRITHFERHLEIDDADQRVQHWYTRFVLRATRASQAIFLTSQIWTGGGSGPRSTEPGDVEILSGMRGSGIDVSPGGTAEHRLLAVRPEFPGTYAFNLYVWDLGTLAHVGQEFELCYRQHLVDEAGTFQTYIGMGTATHDHIVTIKLRAKVPEAVADVATGIQHEVMLVSDDSQTARYIAPPVRVRDQHEIARDSEGYFTYAPTPLCLGDRYQLQW